MQALVAERAYSARSSDAPVSGNDGDGPSVGDSVGSLDANLDRVLDIEAVRPLLEALPEREQTALRLRFFQK